VPTYVTYTDVTIFQRDFMPSSADGVFPRLIERAARIATSYIDMRLATRYTVPFTAPYPEIIVTISDLLTKCAVAALQARRAVVFPKAGKGTRGGTDECALGREMLDELAEGDAIIPGLTLSATGFHTRDGYVPIFDVDSSVNHRPDSELLRKISRERR
jgi:hypothetical protein